MGLDLAVLDRIGAPERTVSLGIDLHHELVVSAAARGLKCFEVFADYFEDAVVTVDDLPKLVGQIRALKDQTSSVELRRFLRDLEDLIAYAVVHRRSIHAIAD